jgi:hypothetical protein
VPRINYVRRNEGLAEALLAFMIAA